MLKRISVFSLLAIFFIIVNGIVLRVAFVLLFDFPINDGGMFYVMTEELKQSHFFLPKYTTYNFINIPFAYPPLAFYLAGFFSSIHGISLLNVFQYMPLLFSIFCIPVFFLLARVLLSQTNLALWATLFFVLLPKSSEWYIMGGGLTRSVGFFFLLTTIYCACKLFYASHKKYLLLTALFFALTILSHLEMALFAVYTVILFFLFAKKSKEGLQQACLVILLGIFIAAPWWIMIFFNHGFGPFSSALQTGNWSLYSFFEAFYSLATGDPFVPLLAFLGMLGLLHTLLRGNGIFLTWIVGMIFLSPRGAPNVVTVPFALLIAVGFLEVVIKGLFYPSKQTQVKMIKMYTAYKIFFMVLFLIYQTSSLLNFYINSRGSLQSLSKKDREAMQWVVENTKSTASFLVITSSTLDWGRDEVVEWFPVVAKRRSVNTLQGTEWLPNGAFKSSDSLRYQLINCYTRDSACLADWQQKAGVEFDYVYISLGDNGILERYNHFSSLRSSFSESGIYTLMYKNYRTEIWSVGKGSANVVSGDNTKLY